MGGDLQRGVPFVLSGPSGAGKTTLARRLLAEVPGIAFSISYTTRPRRDGEQDGRDYHFIDDERFERMVAEGRFLEWANVHGRRYGTGREASEEILTGGHDLLLDVDVQGGQQIRASGIGAVLVLLLPPDLGALARRLRERSREEDDEVSRRLSVAPIEAAEVGSYDYVVINDELDRAYEDLRSIVRAERRRVSRCGAEVERILGTFAAGS